MEPPKGVVQEFASAIVAESRKKPPLYGSKPKLEALGATLQCVDVTGGIAFALHRGKKTLVFHDIHQAVQAFMAHIISGKGGMVYLDSQLIYKFQNVVLVTEFDKNNITGLLRNPPMVFDDEPPAKKARKSAGR